MVFLGYTGVSELNATVYTIAELLLNVVLNTQNPLSWKY